jgi:hypothetical protein
MATIATILIGVISLLGKQNELMREVFWWLVRGEKRTLNVCFPPKKSKMSAHHPPPPSAHFQLFGGRQYIVKKNPATKDSTV